MVTVFVAMLFIAGVAAEQPKQCTESQECDSHVDELHVEDMSMMLLQQSTQHTKVEMHHGAVHQNRGPIDPADVLGTCSGTGCPPEYSADRPCPPGCTSAATASTVAATTTAAAATTTAAAATTYTDGTLTWATGNSQSYMCSSMGIAYTQGTVVCGQSGYESGTGGTATLTCDAGAIVCFLFASGGKVGGSCGGDAFYEDGYPTNSGWGYMADATGSACLGSASCALAVTDGAVNGAAVSPATTAGGKFNFKALALCQ